MKSLTITVRDLLCTTCKNSDRCSDCRSSFCINFHNNDDDSCANKSGVSRIYYPFDVNTYEGYRNETSRPYDRIMCYFTATFSE